MGETKEKRLHLGFSIARIVTAALAGIFFVAAFAQILFFQDIRITFNTITDDAQQIDSIKMKKGSKVDLPTPLKPGSYFKGWSLSADSKEAIKDSTVLMQDTTLYAIWDGAEKYAVLSVNGMPWREVNIFDTRMDGLTADELTYGKEKDHSDSWRVLDDYAVDNENRKNYDGIMADPYNNFSRFLGWQYLNAYNTYNDLLYDGATGIWTWVQRDENNNETRVVIDDEHKFYPPNYRTTFKALLDYRVAYIEFYDDNNNGSRNDAISVKLGETVDLKTFNIFKKKLDAHFSYWKLTEGNFKTDYINAKEYPELANNLTELKKRYSAGESFTLDPLLYYYGLNLMPQAGDENDLTVSLKFNAVCWNDTDTNVANHQYTMQAFTDRDSGTQYQDFKDTNFEFENLSAENPVAYDDVDDCVWLYKTNEVFSYAFYDHNGVYHVIKTDAMDETKGIALGDVVNVFGDEVYFNENWGINIMVNYPSSNVMVDVVFDYGSDLYLLPNYRPSDQATSSFTSRIGGSFEMLTGEKYMKENYIFAGWQMVGDASEHIYSAGEKITIPNFDTVNESTTIRFTAVWRLQRLLFNFDFDGGSWATAEGPDFTLMKGAYKNWVKVVNEEPVKFGYDFIGWTLEDDTEKYYHPGDDIKVGVKYQTLHAHWQPRRLSVRFKFKNNNLGTWADYGMPVEKNFQGEDLYSGDEIRLTSVSNNDYYTFDGWQLDQVVPTGVNRYALTTDVLSQLETYVTTSGGKTTLNVVIYAAQTKATVAINFFNQANQVVSEDGTDLTDKVDVSRLVNLEIPQGDLFYNYYPFSVSDYAKFDSHGRPFIKWEYTIDGSRYVAIDENTTVPANVDKGSSIRIYGQLGGVKSIEIEFYNHLGRKVESTIAGKQSIGGSFNLPQARTGWIETEISGWGTFVGWAPEPDHQAGNPAVIFDVYYFTADNGGILPRLSLSTEDKTSATTASPYLIATDQYTELAANSSRDAQNPQYVLKLYAVYAKNNATITYNNLNTSGISSTVTVNTNLALPVYSNGDYTQTKIGGRTVGNDSPDFVQYGNTVLDDNGLAMWPAVNFVGWQAVVPDGVSDAVRAQFVNKIWFPGDALPSIDFDLTFLPIRVSADGRIHETTIGNKTYRILALSTPAANYKGSVDIVALPRGNYTVEQGDIRITSDREVRVVVPSEGDINLQPRAIQCNTVKEFYVGDNLTITGSPVVGNNFQTYRIKKGYRKIDGNTATSIVSVDGSTKYDFRTDGLLVSIDQSTLFGVPSHTAITTTQLSSLVQSISTIAEYALSDLNTLQTINLSKSSGLIIAAHAVHNVTAQNVVLPDVPGDNSSVIVDAQVLSGALKNLQSVTFGNQNKTSTAYAFVENGLVYYLDIADRGNLTAKKHLMYVLRSANLTDINYVGSSLVLPDTITTIEPDALSGLDWTTVKAVSAENTTLDLRNLLTTVPNDIPLFTSVENVGFDENWYQGTRIQSYLKTFKFTYNGQTEIRTFAYGQTFRVFSAQNNTYNIKFDKEWSHFKNWKYNGTTLEVGAIGRIGYSIGDNISFNGSSDINTYVFDATSTDSWQAYPVRFITYNNYQPENGYTFKDIDNVNCTIGDLLNKSLSGVYLPALEQTFTVNGETYQFIGWSKASRYQKNDNFNDRMLWNMVDVKDRILPNKTVGTYLSNGTNSNGIYVYCALYEKVTPNLQYDLESDGTYRITGATNYSFSGLYIPFARYNDETNYMAPVTKIKDRAFNSISTALTNGVEIGGAVNTIGEDAFNGIRGAVKFNHQGQEIVYNSGRGTPHYLTIGKGAFASNAALISLTLPLSVESIERGAFENCSELTTVTFAGTTTGAAALRKLGDFVFRGDGRMNNNAIVGLLENDTRKTRFTSVGSGIFQHTAVKSVDPNKDRIVWGDTLLRIYYTGVGSNEPKGIAITEKVIAGYAFADLGGYDNNGNLVPIKLNFTNAALIMKDAAFGGVHESINEIYINDQGNFNLNNISVNAFDEISSTHATLKIHVSLTDWETRFKTSRVEFMS